MIEIVFLLALFICISSIFFPDLRKLAKAILATAAVLVFGCWLILEIIAK